MADDNNSTAAQAAPDTSLLRTSSNLGTALSNPDGADFSSLAAPSPDVSSLPTNTRPDIAPSNLGQAASPPRKPHKNPSVEFLGET